MAVAVPLAAPALPLALGGYSTATVIPGPAAVLVAAPAAPLLSRTLIGVAPLGLGLAPGAPLGYGGHGLAPGAPLGLAGRGLY